MEITGTKIYTQSRTMAVRDQEGKSNCVIKMTGLNGKIVVRSIGVPLLMEAVVNVKREVK